MDDVGKSARPACDAVAAGSLAGFQDAERAGNADREDIQPGRRATKALVHGAVVQHMVENDGVAAVDQRAHRGRHRLYKAAKHRPETRHDGRRRSCRRCRHHLDAQRRERIVFSLPTGIGAAVVAWRGHQDEVVEAHDEIGRGNRRLQRAAKRGLART